MASLIDFGLGVQLGPFEGGQIYCDWRNDPKVWRWTRQNDLIDQKSHLNWHSKQQQDPSVKMYSVFKDGRLVGACGLTSINLVNLNAEFSLYIAPDFQRKGIGQPALKTLFYHGFINMGLKAIWGETFENNPAQKMFKAIGMKEDGRRRQFYWKDGQFWDAILFSVLEDEFLALHGKKSCF